MRVPLRAPLGSRVSGFEGVSLGGISGLGFKASWGPYGGSWPKP